MEEFIKYRCTLDPALYFDCVQCLRTFIVKPGLVNNLLFGNIFLKLVSFSAPRFGLSRMRFEGTRKTENQFFFFFFCFV